MTIYNTLKSPTRLYIKQCPHCKLKYFGKTTNFDIKKYKGGGIRWNNHIRKHQVKPIHLWNSKWYYDESIIKFALRFSKLNKIVENNSWANLKEENGLDGGSNCQQMLNKETREKSSKTCLQKYGVDHPFKFLKFRKKALETCENRYKMSRGQILSKGDAVNKRNQTNLNLYGSKCAANKDGNKKSIETQKRLLNRDSVKIIKCLSAFSNKSLKRNWYLLNDENLILFRKYLIDNVKILNCKGKTFENLNRYYVKLIIMINRLVTLKLKRGWFSENDAAIEKLFLQIKENHPKEFCIALQSYLLIFSK